MDMLTPPPLFGQDVWFFSKLSWHILTYITKGSRKKTVFYGQADRTILLQYFYNTNIPKYVDRSQSLF